MAITDAPDGTPDAGTDILPGHGNGNGNGNGNGAVPDSDVNVRPAEWMTRPPSGAKTYDYRLKGLDLGADLVAEPAPRIPHTKRAANRRARHRLYIQWSIVIVVIAILVATVRMFVAEPVTINSNAMVPTLPSGTSVL